MYPLLRQNVSLTQTKCIPYSDKMYPLLRQNVSLTPPRARGITGLEGCLKRRSLKKDIKNKDLKKQSKFSTTTF